MMSKTGAMLVMALALPAGAELFSAPPTRSLPERALSPEVESHVGNPCKHELDGMHCDDDTVIECAGGQTVSHEVCAFNQECKKNRQGPGSASCEEDICDDKADGFHCKDDRVVECSGLLTVNSTECAFYQECERDRSQLVSAACVEDVCARKADGQHCKDDHVVECRGFKTVNTTKCGVTEECKKNALGINAAACIEDDCHGKADGQYCKHDGVVECVGQAAVKYTRCPFYQECSHGVQLGKYVASCQEDACEDKADGWHCKGNHLVQCASFVTTDIKICPSYKECEQSFGAEAACM